VNDLVKKIGDTGCSASLYADDLAILPNADGKVGGSQLRTALLATGKWLTEEGLTANLKPGKTSILTIHRVVSQRNTVGMHSNFRLQEEDIPRVDQYTYLGVILDQKLNFQHHTKHIVTKTKAASALVNRIITRNTHIKPKTIANLVKACPIHIRSAPPSQTE
jgi:hypothetical protein